MSRANVYDASMLLTPMGGRTGAMQGIYFKMCVDLFDDLESAWTAAQAALAGQQESETYGYLVGDQADNAGERAATLAIKLIVIAGMCAEAAIYHYAAWHLGDTDAARLDKLDLLSKWIIIPKLVTQREIPSGRPAYEKLKRLIEVRNRLVHAKSVRLPPPENMKIAMNEALGLERRLVDDAREAFAALILLSLEMDARFGDLTINPLPGCSSHDMLSSGWPPAARAFVAKCRGLLKRSRRGDQAAV